ncbi:MAG: G8 domain-containing protein [Cyanobacteria bacterium P01_D01_bin.156]
MNATSMHNHNSGLHAHPDDPSKQSEHTAAHNLITHQNATHRAIKSGSWFDPKTWAGGRIPGQNAKVFVPDGIKVNYDNVSNTRLFGLRVDGHLDFATNADTKMVIDTFLVSSQGTLTIGTEDNPVQGNVKTEILIADNGAIDTKWDPEQLSRGIVSHGTVSIHGQAKTSHLKVAKDPSAGDKTIALSDVPINWQVGDQIVLTGTEYQVNGTQDEQRTITAINGNRITLDKALSYNHDTPRSDLKAYVANQSRNIVVATENGDKLPANQRGHIMFMHSDNVDVRYVEFNELGRTDKSQLLDDFKVTSGHAPKRILKDGEPITGERTNIRGRYAVHLHRTGVNGDETPAVLVGNSVIGSPGWGIVQHDSYAVLENNVAYDVFGAGFVSETGNEIGAWRNNISIKNEGRPQNEKSGAYNHDLGFGGHGFWAQGRLVELEGNVAAGNSGAGIFYFHRGVDEIDPLAENLAIEAWAKGQSTVLTSDPPIMGFKDNEVLGSNNGLVVIKNSQVQHHDARTVLDGFTAWEVAQGTNLQYTAHYTLKDFDLVGTETSLRKNVENNGVHLFHNVEDIVFDNLKTEGFGTGVHLNKETRVVKSLNDWGYIFIDPEVKNNDKDWHNLDRKVDKFLSSSDIKSNNLSFQLNGSKSDFAAKSNETSSSAAAAIYGTKTDSLGTIVLPFGNETLGYPVHQLRSLVEQQGYYTLTNGQRAVVVDEYISDRLTGDMKKYSFVVTLENKNWTQNARHLGTLNPSQLKQDNKIISYDSLSADYPEFVQKNLQPESLRPKNSQPPTTEPPVVEQPHDHNGNDGHNDQGHDNHGDQGHDGHNHQDPVDDMSHNHNDGSDSGTDGHQPDVIFGSNNTIRVQAERYNVDDFKDVNTANRGGAGDALRRSLAVDVGKGGDGGFNVGWISKGEYLTYTIEVPEAGEYRINASIASKIKRNHSLKVTVDGESTKANFKETDGWQNWQSAEGNNVLQLSKGTHTLRVDMLSSGFNLDYVELEQVGGSIKVATQPTSAAPTAPTSAPEPTGNDPVLSNTGGTTITRDLLTGTSGDDKLKGTDAAERFDAGTASRYDITFGRGGDDVFVLNSGSGHLIIRDFESGSDQLELSDGLTFGAIEQTQRNGKLFIETNGDTLAELTSFSGTLMSSDFITAS